MTRMMARYTHASLMTLMLTASAFGQGWELERVIPVFSDTSTTDHFVLDVEGGLLVCGRSTPQGGGAKVFDRNVGGVHEWDLFHTFDSPLDGFAYALDLSGHRLALSRRRGEDLSDQYCEVQVHDLYPYASADQVVGRGIAGPEGSAFRDGYGHSVLLVGDTLFVGAVGRSHPRGSGAVHVHQLNTDAPNPQWPQVDLLQPAVDGFDLPIMRDFGETMVMNDDHLIVSSPGSGYSSTMRCGALHSFSRGMTSGEWIERAHWFNAAFTLVNDPINFSSYEVFNMNDLGRTGLHAQAVSVFAPWAAPYGSGYWWDAMEAPPLQPACEVCGLRSFSIGSNGEFVPETTWPELDTAIHRGYSAWTAEADRIALNVFDGGTWQTRIYRRTSWAGLELLATIPALDEGIDYNGPIALEGDLFVRSGVQQQAGAPAERSFSVEVYSLDDFTGQVETPRPPARLKAWPSPSNGNGTVSFDTNAAWVLSVISSDGSIVRRMHSSGGVTISLNDLPNGLYLLRASDQNWTTGLFRLVVQ